jgi:predicted dehydrogenase
MNTIKWGIIGCGDVTEVKSGPAFNKVPDSSLVAVMRRDAKKAADYGARHGVPSWYDDAQQLINDPDVNAVYVATPPIYHEEYTIAALKAGKPVYVEKPMALSEAACRRMVEAAIANNTKLSVAHYRRGMPLYLKVKELLDAGVIGKVLFVNLQILQPPGSGIIVNTPENWRVNPAISGGGLFHDLSPHQLDLMIYYFGGVTRSSGYSANKLRLNEADDTVSGECVFENGIFFKGLWCFSVAPAAAKDVCEIVGSEGKITFPFYSNDFTANLNGKEERYSFEPLQHLQQPMIEKVVLYFLDRAPNPCTGEEAAEVLRVMESFTR